MLANKHYTPVIGIDVHFVMIPPSPSPIPIPHPYIGMVIDPMDYVPKIGATVMVNGVPVGNSGTTGMLGIKKHIPLGASFPMMATIAHESANFFGSIKVKADSLAMSPSGYMLMTCNDIGMPITASKNFFLPTSSSIPLPMGKPVMVGGPYPPDLAGLAMAFLMSLGFKALMKMGKGILRAGKGLAKKFKATKGNRSIRCMLGLEPVDLITGRMLYEGEDFKIAGPLPVSWQRTWYSDSDYEGMLGYGFSCNYDVALHLEKEEDGIAMRLPDGRIAEFPYIITENERAYNREEKLTLICKDGKTYEVKDHENQQVYTFKKLTNKLLRPVTLSNIEGFKIQFIYNAANQLEQIIDSANRQIDLSLDKKGRVSKIEASHKNTKRLLVQYNYNEAGDLIEIIDALGKATVMEYKNHLMTKKTDRNGQAFYWEYDGETTGAKCIKSWGDGNILWGTIEYHDGFNILTNSLGQQTTYYFNELNLCTQVTDPLEGNIFHEYTPFMEPYRDIDEEGNTTGYSYDERGNLTALHQPDGSVITYLYDEEDQLVLTKLPGGGSVVRTFKENNLLHAVIGLDGGVTSFEYNEYNLVSEVRDNAGNISQLLYDEDHNINQMLLPNGGISKWTYDTWGRVIQTENAEKHQQQFFYDELDRIRKIRQADNNLVQLKYNAYDEVIQSIDQKNRKINFDYTPLGSLKMREEKGVKVEFTYNTEEQLTSIVNEHKEYYRFSRNAKGEISREIGFDGLVRQYDRDRAGKVLKVNRPAGKYSEYEYDLNGRICRVEHNDDSWATYSYDADGNLIEAANEQSHVIFTRDSAGRILSENQDGHLVHSEYDALGNRSAISSSLGAQIDINRDQAGLVESVKAAVSNKEEKEPSVQQAWEAQFTYNSLGMEVERMLPGGISSQMAYDKAGRPIQQKVTVGNREMRHRTYTWNVNDRLTKMVNEMTKGTVTYNYDAFNNLAGACYEDNQLDYKLPDEVGNLYRTKGKKDRKYGTGGQLLEADGKKFKYDEEGNLTEKLTQKGNWKYEWFNDGMLKSVKRPDNKAVDFEYDALGRRTAKLYDGKITRFVWDGNVPLHEWQYNLKDRPEIVVDEFGMLAESQPEPLENLITWVFDEGTFKPAAKITEDENYSIITDYLGTPIEMYNGQGEKTWQAEYDIYGKVRKLEAGSLNDCPFRYQGQYEDEETGLYYNRFRYYDAEIGTYLSQDKIRIQSGQPNFYSYVHDVNSWIDPFGLAEIFRSMSRAEYFDIQQNGWNSGTNGLNSKWFAESYEDAVDFGHTLGHGSDSKFYVVGFEVDDAIVADAHQVKNLDDIGDAVAIDVDKLNGKPTTVTSVNSHRIKCG